MVTIKKRGTFYMVQYTFITEQGKKLRYERFRKIKDARKRKGEIDIEYFLKSNGKSTGYLENLFQRR